MDTQKPTFLELPSPVKNSQFLTRRWERVCTQGGKNSTPKLGPHPPICNPEITQSPKSAEEVWAAPHLARPPTKQRSAGDEKKQQSTDSRDALEPSLVLFLGATGSSPNGYTRLLRAASDAGHHVLALSYPSCPVAVARANSFCALQKDAGECVERLHETSVLPRRTLPLFLAGRLGLGNSGDKLWYVPPQFSVERLAKDALRKAGWEEQFLTPRGGVRWDRVVAAGHSQGGGHAAYLSRKKGTRAVLLSAPQDEPADWISTSKSTGKLDSTSGNLAGARRIAVFHAREECGERPCSKANALRPGLLLKNLGRLGLQNRCAIRGGAIPAGCNVVIADVRPTCRTGRTFHTSVAKDRCAPRVMDQIWSQMFKSLRY